jgi:hypothetical protein
MAQQVFNQYRSAKVDGVDLSDYDIEVTVDKPSDDPLNYELVVYNLNQDAFDAIGKGDSIVTIELGWENGPQQQVIRGTVEETDRELSGNDLRYIISGQDESEAALTSSVHGSFQAQEPQIIAESLGGEVGLGVETDSVGQPIEPWFSVGTHQPVRYWLDQLVDYAGQYTGDSWTYWAEAGTLYFIRDNGIDDQIPKLSYDGLLTEIQSKENEDTQQEMLDFTAMCEPRIKKGQQVRVDTDRYTGNYIVQDYTYESSDANGDHIVNGTLELAAEPEPQAERIARRDYQGSSAGVNIR